MADYHSPTVLQPVIPIADMTPLERLILTSAFESESDGEDLYLFASCAVEELLAFPAAELAAALDASHGSDSRAAAFVRPRLAETTGPATVELDLTGDFSWSTVLQDIVRRSATVDEVVAFSAFTCTKMRADGFGGMVVLITTGEVLARSTNDMLCELMDEVEHGGPAAKVHLHRARVRRAVDDILAADGGEPPIAGSAVTDRDIWQASCEVADRLDLADVRQQAEFDAALAAIKLSQARLSASP